MSLHWLAVLKSASYTHIRKCSSLPAALFRPPPMTKRVFHAPFPCDKRAESESGVE